MNTKSLSGIATFIIILVNCHVSFTQTLNYDHRSSENPYYWKKNLPHSGYWQQDVHYKMKASISDSTNIVDCPDYELTYWNNSPDTLFFVYFHLYQNAFQPGSYMESVYKNNDKKVSFGDYEARKLGTVCKDIQVNNKPVQIELDNTILKVYLNTPLLPSESATVTMNFKTYFDKGGTLRRRMKYFEEYGTKHFDGVHWYPSICVYDSKFGWTTEQHMDKEFYSDFGTFDVELTFPNDFIVEATGELTNENEVLPQELLEKINLENFKIRNDTISKPIVKDGSTKTWKYHAINVHNFVFTADPKYRKKTQLWNGIKVVTLAMEQNAYKWQPSGDFAEKVTQIYSTDFGQYAWPKIVVADAKDGMEYPMITLDNGGFSGHQGLLAHEMGHMWFYGMIGSNETYRAFMDEGFTQFLTVWSLNKINGDERDYKLYVKKGGKRNWLFNHLEPQRNRYERLYYPYMKWVNEGYDYQLNTHSSAFNGATRHDGGYGLVYYKTGVMLYNLRYVLGEELFLKTMQNYFNTWKMKHPYPEDFRKTVTRFTKTDLNWFFDQWLETTKHIDYSVEKVKAGENDGEYDILFKRIGEMHMPLDFSVYTKSGKEYKYHIPNTWFKKETDATILPKWYGWDNIQPTYTATIKLENEEIENIIIDPERYLADVNLANNQWTKRYKFQFDHKVKNYPNWRATENFWRPDIWYNAYDGLKLGLHVEGNYFQMMNRYSITGSVNSGLLGYDLPENGERNQLFSIRSKFDQNLRKIWRGLESHQEFDYDVGVLKTRLGLSKRFKKQDLRQKNYTTLGFSHQTLLRTQEAWQRYNFINNTWSSNRWNNSFTLSLNRMYGYDHGSGKINIQLRTPGIGSDYNYSYLESTTINRNKLGKKLKLDTRVYGRIGLGTTPAESALFISGANPENLFNKRATDAQGIIPNEWTTIDANYGHFHSSGGLNLRGFSGLAVETTNGTSSYGFASSGASFSTELNFGNYTKIKKGLKHYLSLAPYLFADAGIMHLQGKGFDQVLADAGLGLETQVKFYYLDIKPIIVRLEAPLYISSENEFYANKFIIGLGKSF